MPSNAHLPRPSRGFTLIELAMVLAVVGILSAVAVPSYQAHLAKARRSEAVTALTRLQLAQESFRANHGSYALALPLLRGLGVPLTHYRIELAAAHANGYTARATALAEAPLGDGCRQLSLTVADGLPTVGPTERCWNR
jgi:type IV pilus assembly protein PilE